MKDAGRNGPAGAQEENAMRKHRKLLLRMIVVISMKIKIAMRTR
jgi:hypothetical protein